MEVDRDEASRLCKTCGKHKPLDQYQPRLDRGRRSYRTECKDCLSATRKSRRKPGYWKKSYSSVQEYRQSHPDKVRQWARNAALRKKLDSVGLTQEDYELQLARQRGRCRVCEREEWHRRNGGVKRLAIDHDHESGEFRGLLCHRCNAVLGSVEDSVELLQKLQDYLNGTR